MTFTFENLCSNTVWRASSPSIGDDDPVLETNAYSVFYMDDKWSGSIWARTKCSANASNYFSCETGDCGSGVTDCSGPKPTYPATLLNFNINNPVVSYEVSLVHGQNLLVRIKPIGGTLVDGSGPCPVVDCNMDMGNVCPPSLITYNKDGRYVGCNSACDVLKDPKYCCNGNGCQIDEISQKFKDLCPLAHAYPGHNKPPVYQCKGADRYDITFCPAI